MLGGFIGSVNIVFFDGLQIDELLNMGESKIQFLINFFGTNFFGRVKFILASIISLGILTSVLTVIFSLLIGSFFKFFPTIDTKEIILWNKKHFISAFNKTIPYGLLFGSVRGFTRNVIGIYQDGIFDNLIFGLILGFYTGIFLGLFNNIEKDYHSYIQINKPFQRFKASCRLLHFSIIQYFLLAFHLSKNGLLPFKQVDF